MPAATLVPDERYLSPLRTPSTITPTSEGTTSDRAERSGPVRGDIATDGPLAEYGDTPLDTASGKA